MAISVQSSSLPDPSLLNLVRCIAFLFIFDFICRATYRLFFSPLCSVPGPPIAAATKWYQVYWNVWRGGQLIFEIERLHRIYGDLRTPLSTLLKLIAVQDQL